jgi:hypothetical protein
VGQRWDVWAGFARNHIAASIGINNRLLPVRFTGWLQLADRLARDSSRDKHSHLAANCHSNLDADIYPNVYPDGHSNCNALCAGSGGFAPIPIALPGKQSGPERVPPAGLSDQPGTAF